MNTAACAACNVGMTSIPGSLSVLCWSSDSSLLGLGSLLGIHSSVPGGFDRSLEGNTPGLTEVELGN